MCPKPPWQKKKNKRTEIRQRSQPIFLKQACSVARRGRSHWKVTRVNARDRHLGPGNLFNVLHISILQVPAECVLWAF